MKKNKVFWVDVNHNKLTKEQVNDNYLKNIIKFVCTGGGYYEEMSEDMIRELFMEAKRRKLNINGYTLKQALDEYKSNTTPKCKLFIPNYDFPDYGDKLNPAIYARNVGKNQEKQPMIAVVGLTREELKRKFKVTSFNKMTDTYTDGINIYICVNDLHTNLCGRRFDKIYDFRPLKDNLTMDYLISRLSKAPEGYYIGDEQFEVKLVEKNKNKDFGERDE